MHENTSNAKALKEWKVFTKRYKAMGDHLQDLGAPKEEEEEPGCDKDLHKHSLVDKFGKEVDLEPHHGHQWAQQYRLLYGIFMYIEA